MADVYTNSPDGEFHGAPERTRPRTASGDAEYDTVVDATGKPVSNKPANQAILSGKKARLAHKEKQRAQKASGGGGILPTLLVLAVFVPLLSHFMTGTFHFGVGPTVKHQALKVWRHPSNPLGPKERVFSVAQLAQYDGSDPTKPIYLSIIGEVFDVSANPRMYGKGGAYNGMAGKDASRSFITGCFETHQTHDLRGLSDRELDSLTNWIDFFTNSPKYFRVGKVILPKIDPKSPIPKPCNVAAGDEAPAHHKQGGHAARAGGNSHARTK